METGRWGKGEMGEGGDGNSGGGIARPTARANRGFGNTLDGDRESNYDNPSVGALSTSYDNSSNLDIPGRNGEQPVNYKEMIPYLEKVDNRNFERNAAATGLAALASAFGKTGGFSTVFGSYTPR